MSRILRKPRISARLDQNSVGKLVKMAVELGRGAKPELKIGICGEHSGDPSSVEFCIVNGAIPWFGDLTVDAY